MSIKSFLKLVEIQTKVASVMPFILGTLYSVYRYKAFDLKNFILMFLSLLCFDMATTAINNYYDYKKATNIKGNDYKKKNIIGSDNLNLNTVRFIIVILVLIAIGAGIILTLNTDIVVLIIGMISFLVGIFYTYGPIPLSRMPLGELFSGFFMGVVIIFLSIYIHIYDTGIIYLGYENNIVSMTVNIKEIIYIFLISVPAFMGISNIMLANNICDVEEDIVNKRFTLPYYIGKENAVKLFKWLYYIAYLDIALIVALRVAPVVLILSILSFKQVKKNIDIFSKEQIKSKTFIMGVKNFIIMTLYQIVLVAIGILI
ncbi:1,4-dihydroxy-2-naphthoate polyprenyltransferase [Clostridium sp.]|uniref:1,4-dihydroxy-2-naphthoate polyprenyltransferase n=1 Tax=Clostridium sp. TaxID=1506 RepID=UPI003463CE1D